MKCPCYGCGQRETTCHARCENYIAYKKETEDIRKRKYLDSHIDFLQKQGMYDHFYRNVLHRKKRGKR